MIHWLFGSMLFRFHIFVFISSFLPVVISSFMMFWWEGCLSSPVLEERPYVDAALCRLCAGWVLPSRTRAAGA